ncbi:MAG TPA: isopentenyl-diphosphate Delta-isomerase [Micromonosporaceae bacterium]|nr:isopentenyl-diphosphate Delta-isomerase [Micromonosporaceae bacterium]
MTLAGPAYPESSSRETHLVQLVDTGGAPLGVATVAAAHRLPGQLHRAFSVLLTDGHGRFLLQQRSARKTRFALLWANTCCGHPLPDEDLKTAGINRLRDEMGLAADDLSEVGRFVYRAEDPASGRVEYEYDHVLIGQVPVEVRPDPNPDEVAEWRWADLDTVRADLAAHPARYAPWLGGVINIAAG